MQWIRHCFQNVEKPQWAYQLRCSLFSRANTLSPAHARAQLVVTDPLSLEREPIRLRFEFLLVEMLLRIVFVVSHYSLLFSIPRPIFQWAGAEHRHLRTHVLRGHSLSSRTRVQFCLSPASLRARHGTMNSLIFFIFLLIPILFSLSLDSKPWLLPRLMRHCNYSIFLFSVRHSSSFLWDNICDGSL